MKKRTSLISLLIIVALTAGAQVPQKFNYQAVLRDYQNGLIANQMVYFKISILEGSADGSPVYVETHSVNVNEFGLANLVIGDGSLVSGSFMEISWGENDHFLKVEVGLAGSMVFQHVGTSQLISVPYALYSANISSPTRKFTIQENPGHPVDSALFEVRNLEGQTVFAVYPEGTRVYVLDEEAKGKKGGFSVGGYSRTTKGVTQEYMRVTPDSIRLYIDESDTKGKKGGFAVGGYSRTTKGESDYFNISAKQEAEIIPGVNRVVWYPQRNAFLVGNVLVEDPNNVGENSIAAGYQSQAIGDFSQAFGHQSYSSGKNSTAIGNNAKAQGLNSVSIGNYANAGDTSSFALGTGAGAFGVNSYAIGSAGIDSAGLPTDNTTSWGDNSFALGMGSISEGSGSVSLGTRAETNGDFSLALGYGADAIGKFSTAIGRYADAIGESSIAMGASAKSEGVESTAIGRIAIAAGKYSTSIGFKTTANGGWSTALGTSTMASGGFSTAIGFETTASGYASMAMGRGTIAAGNYSTAMGKETTAARYYSTAMGAYTTADGQTSTAMGWYTRAGSFCSMAIGRYNDFRYGDTVSWVETEPLFIIGNGSDEDNLSNAMLVRKDGAVYFPDVYGDIITSSTRDLYINSTGQLGYLSSSSRYKSNITLMEDVNWLYDLTPVNFYYKADESKTKMYGLIAEEVEDVNPLFVSYNNDGEPETVSYSQLISPMIKALQDQDKLIKELQARIEELERE